MQETILKENSMSEEEEEQFCFVCKTRLPESENGKVQCPCCKAVHTNSGEDHNEQLGKLIYSGAFFEEEDAKQ
jgi:hypothetical protein